MSEKEIKLDATTLRGLAHPMRVRILGLLREYGPATATTLSQRLGQSTGVTSYHLRQLGAYGFVIDDPDRNVGRERWWKAAHGRTRLEMPGDSGDSEVYLRAVAAQYAERVDRFLNEAAALPEPWRACTTLSDFSLRLTPERAERLHHELFALIGGYRDEGTDEGGTGEGGTGEGGTGRVVVQLAIMPFVEEP